MNKNISVLSVVIVIIILLRCIFDSNDNVIYIVAGINIVAIIFVVYTIIENILNNIIEKIKKSKVPKQIIKREITSTRFKIWGWSIGISAVAITVYLWQWCSGLGNDIISILALGISILDDEIVRKVTDNYKI
jgi:hypothetical protein